MAEPLVSVSIITYNHRNYISDAIDSALMQEVDFPYEIIIGDDCSDDGTTEIVKRYEKRYPHKIFGIYHPRRYNCIPGRVNNLTNLLNCRGRYIAMLDGDDFWMHKHKLQQQVDFLQDNPGYAVAFHDEIEVKHDGTITGVRRSEKEFPALKNRLDFDKYDVARRSCMPTSSLVYRNIFQEEFPEWIWSVYNADYALLLMLSEEGSLRYFPDLLGGYRISQQSYSRTYGQSEAEHLLKIREWSTLGAVFPALRVNRAYQKKRGHFELYHARLLYRNNKFFTAFYYWIKAHLDDPFIGIRYLKYRKKLFWRHR